MSSPLKGNEHWDGEAGMGHGPVVACPRCGVRRKMRKFEPDKPCWDCKVLMDKDEKRRATMSDSDAHHPRFVNLGDAKTVELEERVWELYEHDYLMDVDDAYFMRVMDGKAREPRQGLMDDDWNSIPALEGELDRRDA